MTAMSLGLELALFGGQVPFIAERNYRKLPAIKAGAPMPEPISDVWTVLALLIEGHNDQTVRAVLKQNCAKNRHALPVVRIALYSSGYTRGEWTSDHDFPIKVEVVDELVRNRYVVGTPRLGYTDNTELKLTEQGQRALVDHLHTLK